MKLFALVIATLLLSVHVVTAAAPLPSQSVWVTPPNASAGAPIELNALVYNTTDATITVTVSFATTEKVIAIAPVMSVPSQTAKVATASWTMPAISTTVTAAITKATSVNKDVTTLHGDIGTVTIGGIMSGSIGGWMGKIVGKLERFRLHQADIFTDKLAKSRAVLGNMTVAEVTSVLKPDATTATSTDNTQTSNNGSIMNYVMYAYASAGKALFNHKVMYYVIIVLAVLWIVRLIARKLL